MRLEVRVERLVVRDLEVRVEWLEVRVFRFGI